jgi:hypothetical protein
MHHFSFSFGPAWGRRGGRGAQEAEMAMADGSAGIPPLPSPETEREVAHSTGGSHGHRRQDGYSSVFLLCFAPLAL